MARAESKPDFEPHFLEGIEHFNARQFWEAHESWETLWLVAESELHQFLQGLIQIAAAYHHLQRGTLRGAVRLFDAALKRLQPFPPSYCGIERTNLVRLCHRHRLWASEATTRDVGRSRQLPDRLADDDYPTIRFDQKSFASLLSGKNW